MSRAFQFLLCFAAMLGAYALIVRFAPEPRVRVYQSLAEQNTAEAQRVLYNRPAPVVVFVGSSLGSRLLYHSFDRCFQNLSLAGQSSLTGLELLARSDLKPQTVLVETNVLYRELDRSFVRDVERPLARSIPMFRAENRPVNLATSYVFSLHYPNEATFVRANESEIADRVANLGLSLQQKQYNVLLDPALVSARIQSFRSAVDAQRARGAQVVLVEMPVHEALRQTPRARQVRLAMQQAFPDIPYWDVGTWPGIDPVRTRDGVHLALGDAMRVGDALAEHLNCARRLALDGNNALNNQGTSLK